jgi:hypothetical protein
MSAEELRHAWQELPPPCRGLSPDGLPAEELMASDPATRAAVLCVRRAFEDQVVALPPPLPRELVALHARRTRRRRSLRAGALAAAAAALLLLLFRSPSREPAAPPGAAGGESLASAEGRALASSLVEGLPGARYALRDDGIELSTGRLRLVLLQKEDPAGDSGPDDRNQE